MKADTETTLDIDLSTTPVDKMKKNKAKYYESTFNKHAELSWEDGNQIYNKIKLDRP